MAGPSAGSGFVANPGKIFGLYAAGLLGLVVQLAVLEQVGVSHGVIGYLLVVATLASYACIGIMSRTMLVSEYYVAGRNIPTVYNGMATAAASLSTASFLGLAGALFAIGYDGLAFLLGGAGGFVLLAMLFAPYLRKSGAYTIPDFLGMRFGTVARLLGVAVLLCVCFTLAVAQLQAVGMLGSYLLDLEFASAIYVGLAVILLASVLGGVLALTWTQVAQYVVLIVAYLVPVALLSAQRYGLPLPQLTYGEALQEIVELERQLQAAGLDAAGAPGSHLEPFTSYDRLNFFALVASLMLGTASLPHILMRSFTTRSVKAARSSVGWALLFVAILFLVAPAYAAFAKLDVLQHVVGQSLEALPQWVYSYGRLGLVQVCGADATTVEALMAACAAAGNADGVVGFGDLSIDRDAIVIATPEMAGLPYVFVALAAAGALAAALATASGLLVVAANALSHDLHYRMADRGAPTGRRLLVARALLIAASVAAAYLASTRPADVLSMAAWALSLAAAGNFPALVLAIWWKRCTAAGAVAGILAGFGVALFYLVGTVYGLDLARGTGEEMAPGGLPWLTDGGMPSVAAAIFGVPVGFAVTILVSLVTPPPPKETQDLVDALRRPGGETLMQDKAA